MKIEIGQIWQRADGRKVRITDKRVHRMYFEYELTPIGKGRKSWKWEDGILNDLKPSWLDNE